MQASRKLRVLAVTRLLWERPLRPRACGGARIASLAGFALVVPALAAAQTGGSLVRGATIGAADGPLAMGAVSALAARSDLIAIADVQACEIVLYDLQRARLERRIGGCGSGPGEFRQIMGIAWWGDSLFVAQRPGNEISVVRRDGIEVRRIRPQLDRWAVAVHAVAVMDDTTLLLSIGRVPSVAVRDVEDSRVHSFLALVNSVTGEVRRYFLQDTEEVSLRNNAQLIRHRIACLGQGSGRGRIAAMNIWRFQGTIEGFPGSNFPRVEFRREVPGYEPRALGRGGMWRPSGYASIGCTDGGVVFKWVPEREEIARGRRGYLEVRDYSGRVLLERELEFSADSGLFGAIGAAHGDRLYLFANTIFEFPVVLEYRLQVAGLESR